MAHMLTGIRKEPQVISLALLVEGIEDPDVPADRAGLDHSRLLQHAKCLSLSFKNISKIENIVLVKNLRKLCLDNNKIKKIEGLETLENLTWLDLSFNALTVIEGLDKLTKLTDLSLFNNEIASISGLENLKELQCLSLANNKLTQLEEILTLRQLPNLQVLALDGNPMARKKPEAYRNYCMIFLTRLRYLDYALITPADVSAAKETGVNSEKMAEYEEREKEKEKVREAEAQKAKTLAMLTEANIEVAETLLDDMFSPQDVEYQKIRKLPGLNKVMEGIRETYGTSGTSFREQGQDRHGKIQAEIAAFEFAYREAVQGSTEQLQQLFSRWEAAYKHIYRAVQHDKKPSGGGGAAGAGRMPSRGLSSGGARGGAAAAAALLDAEESVSSVSWSDMESLRSQAGALKEAALKDEVELHGNVEMMIETFETVMTELKASKLGLQEVFFREMEALASNWLHEALRLAEEFLTDVAAHPDGFPGDVDEDLAALMHDRDALLAAVTNSHDFHLRIIANKEKDLKARESKRCEGAVLSSRDKEHRRSRARVSEIAEWLRDAELKLEQLRGELIASGNLETGRGDY